MCRGIKNKKSSILYESRYIKSYRDSVLNECSPTFNTSPNEFIGLIPGRGKAFIKAVENAEDSEDLGKDDLIKRNLNFCKNYICIGLGVGGRTLCYGRIKIY